MSFAHSRDVPPESISDSSNLSIMTPKLAEAQFKTVKMPKSSLKSYNRSKYVLSSGSKQKVRIYQGPPSILLTSDQAPQT